MGDISLLYELERKISKSNITSNIRSFIDNNTDIKDLLDSFFCGIVENGKIKDNFLDEVSIKPDTERVIYSYININNIEIEYDINTTIFMDAEEDEITYQYYNYINSLPPISNNDVKELLIRYHKLKEQSDIILKNIISCFYNEIDFVSKKRESKIPYNKSFFILVSMLERNIKNLNKDNFIYDKTDLSTKKKNSIILFEKELKQFDFRKKIEDINPNVYQENNIDFTKSLNMFNDLYSKEIDIRNYIAEHNLKIVLSRAGKYKNNYYSYKDLVQEGSEELLSCIERFDINGTTKFSTYAYACVSNRFKRIIAYKPGMLYLPSGILGNIRKYHKFTKEFIAKNNRYPTDEEICEGIKISLSDLGKIVSKKYEDIVSLDIPKFDNDEDNVVEFIPDNTNVEETVVNNIFKKEVHDVLNRLNPLDRGVLIMRNGIVPLSSLVISRGEKTIIIANRKLYTNEINNILKNNGINTLIANELYDLVKPNTIVKLNKNVGYVIMDGVPIKLKNIAKLLGISHQAVNQIDIRSKEKLKRLNITKNLYSALSNI